ncbi:LysR family transcriptional regulator [Streptomyces sp. DSM 42041]|uniref:LysR family transcriptional regulator n=1 Tax=Streptomyces hazeniae TaxID=3075538 RepID=A0ABU2NV41_9ACTN|nr:LysR family transcriptional regulator [Streptomyces sp. DSM 42041]MDT0380835.1 LysR family transcriptional regulator [Streptomyces sp. DSM 42041]
MIDLRRVRVLRALAEHGTVTATAAALHLTPSAVSQQLRQLSRDVGAELLRQDGRRVRLTTEAQVLLRHADVLFAQWESAAAELAEAGHAAGREVAGSLRVCGVSSALAALAAPAVQQLRRWYPRLDVRLAEEESADCFRLLTAEEADIALVLPGPDLPPVVDPRFESVPLLDDRQDLLVPSDHRLAGAGGGGERLVELAGEDWIVKRRDNDSWPLLATACAAAGFTPHVVHEVKEWYAVSALVGEGLGVCLLPRIVPVPSRHAVVRVPLRGEVVPSRRLLGCVRRGSAEHPLVAAGLEALRRTARRAGETEGGSVSPAG